MDVNKIEYHLEFYNDGGERIEHYGNMQNAFNAPRQGEHVSLLSKEKTLVVTRVVHYFAEYQTPSCIGWVTRVYGKDIPFESHN